MIRAFFASTIHKVLVGVIALAFIGVGIQTTRLAWEKTARAEDAAKADRDKLEAVMKAVKAEREAQAKFTEREQERETTTRDLREAAAKAEPGSKTKAVLDALRTNR